MGRDLQKNIYIRCCHNFFKVEKTPGTINTPIGIARTVLKSLSEKTNIFIVEMGAYKIGEIKGMCDIVHPAIGVLTAVNQQHISLFGSIENTMQAKYELIQSLPQNGLAVFNGNNQNAKKLFDKTKGKKIMYGTDKMIQVSMKNSVTAKNIQVEKLNVAFEAFYGGAFIGKVKVNLLGEHVVENVLPVIAIAKNLRISNDNILKAMANIHPLKKTMQPLFSKSGAIFIDDTFNANPDAVLAASKYAGIYRGKRGLVLQPMIELGAYGSERHREVGQSIGKNFDYLFLTNSNFLEELKAGIHDSKGKCELMVIESKKCATFIKETFDIEDIVIFEGKEAGNVLSLLDYSLKEER